ncbi:MAG: alpha/beta hydrolase [Acidimicrobiales bacterium]
MRRWGSGLVVLLVALHGGTVSAGAAPSDVSPEEDNPPGCVTATSEDVPQCGAQGRSGGGAPIKACATHSLASGSTVTRILPDGPRHEDGTLAFIPGACVYLPPGYGTAGLRYPVLYLLHGGGGDQADWITQGQLAEVADAAAAADPADALIVVMPDGRSGQWFDYRDGSFLNERYVLEHLIEAVDERFATIATRRGRAIVGLSNGGYGAMHLAAKAPDRFVAAGSMSGNLAALSMGGLGTPAADGVPPLQETGAWYYGSLPAQLASNLDPVDLILDWGAWCSSDLSTDLCLRFAFEQAFANGNRTFRDRLATVGYTGTIDYRETEGAHAWWWWTTWLRERHLPFVLARMADPAPAVAPIPTEPLPPTFRYRSIRPAFSVFGYTVEVERDVLEFLDLIGVSADGFTLVGSGAATVTTAARYDPGASYALTGASRQAITADRDGRLRIAVDLGPSHTQEQFSPAARAVQDLPGYFTSRTVTITRATDPAPIAAAVEPAVTAAPIASERLPATGGASAVLPVALALAGAVVLLQIGSRATPRR